MSIRCQHTSLIPQHVANAINIIVFLRARYIKCIGHLLARPIALWPTQPKFRVGHGSNRTVPHGLTRKSTAQSLSPHSEINQIETSLNTERILNCTSAKSHEQCTTERRRWRRVYLVARHAWFQRRTPLKHHWSRVLCDGMKLAHRIRTIYTDQPIIMSMKNKTGRS